MGIPSGPELLIIVFIILLLFGAKRLPELAQGLGKGIREFKSATKEESNPPESKSEPSKTQSKDEE